MSIPVRIEIEGDIGWVTITNPPVNATSTSVRSGLLEAVQSVQGCRLAVLKCTGRTFIAGGDISEFDKPPAEPHLPDVVNAIENSETPFLALLHGNVLGGGLEVAMACMFRIAAPGTRFGLPEVNLGLVPGAGGTQRAPRLLGWDCAVQMACLGKLKTAQDMLNLKALDAIEKDLDAAARLFSVVQQQAASQRIVEEMSEDESDRLRNMVLKSAKGQSAPLRNFEALQWASKPFSEGQPLERNLHLKLRQSDESKALRHIFFAERAVAKPALIKGVAPCNLSEVAVVGGGLMGSGITAACLNAGLKVNLIERDQSSAGEAYQRVKGLLQGALDRNKISTAQFAERLSSFSTHHTYDAAAGADLAIEAVFEDVDAKRAVFASLEKVMSKDAILATNTSYLDPELVFSEASHLGRCIGIHFFSPAHIMKLVEVVRTPHCTPEVIASAFSLAVLLRKTPVLSGICDGFIGNRILSVYRRGAEYMLADGALPREVDAAMRDFGMAMGPFEVQDLTGLQIALASRRRQDETRDPSERYVTISDLLCERGRTGQRSGMGWYRYEDGNRKPLPDTEVQNIILDYSREAGLERREISKADIQNQLLAIMANEGAKIVEESIAENDEAVDVVKIHGYGFPRWRGGPMHWAGSEGDEKIRASLQRLEASSPNSWKRANRFK